MFDQTPPNLPIAPEPEDMFSKVEPAPSPPGDKPLVALGKGPGESSMPAEAPAEVKPPLIASRGVIIGGGIILGVLMIVGIGYGVLSFVKRTALPPQEATLAPLTAVPVLLEEPLSPPPPAPVVQVPIDTDGDGLTDAEEASLGTDPGTPDSDTDGLFDREETQTYRTDPLNSDTDGDTYLDGQEVRGGYDPKGPGKLFTVPSQQP